MLGIHCSNVNCNATLQKGRDGETDESLVARWNAAPRKANVESATSRKTHTDKQQKGTIDHE